MKRCSNAATSLAATTEQTLQLLERTEKNAMVGKRKIIKGKHANSGITE